MTMPASSPGEAAVPADRSPVSTYRLQLHGGFGFADASAVVPYLSALGITDCYCSPIFTARPGSTHGYDVVNHNQINPELGGETAFEAFAAALTARGLGMILDFVPNHMGNDPRTNHWWRDVLENGPSSPYARVFDIDWDPVKPELKERLLLPILGEPYGAALEAGRLTLGLEQGALVLSYGEQRLPVNPRRSSIVLEWNIEHLAAALGDGNRHLREYRSIITALRNLPPYTVREAALVAERHREKEVARERLLALVAASPEVRSHIDAALAAFNGSPGHPETFDRLHDLLEQQPYRLASWRTASDEINYRRFFDINELAGLRVEDPQVFAHIHRLVLDLAGRGVISGLRLDHIDGLADPTAYLRHLQAQIADARQAAGVAPSEGRDFHVIVEKILSEGEQLHRRWPTAGTTGYNFLNDVNGVFVDGRHKRRFVNTYVRFTGDTTPLADVIYESKRLIISTALSSEFQVLVSAVNRLSEGHRGTRDFTFSSIRRALREVVACFPVYRTYASTEGLGPQDPARVDTAIAGARARNPALEPSIFDFLRSVLLPEAPRAPLPADEQAAYERRLAVAMKFQQYTAPVQAKGIEDTAFYRHVVLLSLNEVGGEPDQFGRPVDHFHAASRHRLAHWPLESTATATHDTKRGEDARARLNVLSELPQEWREAVLHWTRLTRPARRRVGRQTAPHPVDEYHFYQALLAVWPPEHADATLPRSAPDSLLARLREYMTKAIREAKARTSWINPNAPYEEAVLHFLDEALTGAAAPPFLASFVPFARRVARLGAINSLSQLVLKLVAPGVPDFFQGTEFWDLTLVDPDNRRPVDYGLRIRALEGLEPRLSRAFAAAQDESVIELDDLLSAWPDGRIKLYVTACGLRLRRELPQLFLAGEYESLASEGSRAVHVVACGRAAGDDRIIAAVPRLPAALPSGGPGLSLPPDAWSDTRIVLPPAWQGRQWRNILTGAPVTPVARDGQEWLEAGGLLGPGPVALLRATRG